MAIEKQCRPWHGMRNTPADMANASLSPLSHGLSACGTPGMFRQGRAKQARPYEGQCRVFSMLTVGAERQTTSVDKHCAN